MAALSLSGLPSDRFLFLGFPPSTATARQTWLRKWLAVDSTLILFESPRRVNRTLADLCQIDPDRITVIARELTKKFEEVIRGTAAELAADPRIATLKGEVVMVLDRPSEVVVDDDRLRQVLERHMATMSIKDAAREAAQELGLSRRDVYQRALELGGQK